MYTEQLNSFDRTVHSLCEEIDFLQEEVQYWKQKYENEIMQRNIESKERLIDAQKGVANALRFALAVKDDENGNLIITKEKRKELAENLR